MSVIRWWVMLPISIVGALLSTFPLHWILIRLLSFVDPYPGIIERALTPLVVGCVFVILMYLSAPKYKRVVGYISGIIYAALFVILMIFVLLKITVSQYFISFDGDVGPMPTIMGVFGGILGLFIVDRLERSEEETKTNV